MGSAICLGLRCTIGTLIFCEVGLLIRQSKAKQWTAEKNAYPQLFSVWMNLMSGLI